MKTKHLFQLFLLSLSILFVFGCKDEDLTNNNPTTPPEPYITLTTPQANQICGPEGNIDFSWDFYSANRAGKVKYELILDAINKNGTASEMKFTDITQKSFSLNLNEHAHCKGVHKFKWKVIAKYGDRFLDTAESPLYSFATVMNLNLSTSDVTLQEGESTTVNITDGSGNYTLSNNNNVATASLQDNTITITGETEGTAIITVTDTKTQQRKVINVTVTRSNATINIQDKTYYIASLHAGSTTLQGKITSGLQIKLPYSKGQGSYGAITAQQTTESGEGGDTKTLRLDIPAGNLNGDGELTATISVSGNGTYLVRQMSASNNYYTIATFAIRIAGKPVNVILEGVGGVLDKLYNVKTNGEYEHQFVYIPITGPDGRIWLNNNLGADYANVNSPDFNPMQQAKSKTDHHAYGSLYQWGREGDGHELINWSSATEGTPKHDKGWKVVGELNTYNDPCPNGYHTPTHYEWGELEKAVTGVDGDNKIWEEKVLNLSASGRRDADNAMFNYQGTYGWCWSSSKSCYPSSWALYFDNGSSYTGYNGNRAIGLSVRCIKD